MVEFFVIEMCVLYVMAIITFIMSFGILYLGHKKGTPNVILWIFFIFIRGLHWFIEATSNYYEEILDKEMHIFSPLELFTAFTSSFMLIAACIEYNGMIRKHIGKIIVFLIAIFPLYFILTISKNTLEIYDELYIIKGDIVSTEFFRFMYGFILPLIAIIALIITYFYYYIQTKKKKVFYNPKLLKITLLLIILIFIFSIFEGFDYFEDQELELVFISMRCISLTFFIIIPLVIVFTYDLGLQKFLIIEHSGLPLLIYSFETKSALTDEVSFLTSGFLTAILGFSKELTKTESGFLSIQSNYLYYIITKTESKIYALQSILKNKYLEKIFFQASKEIDNLISTKNSPTVKINLDQVKAIIDTFFIDYY